MIRLNSRLATNTTDKSDLCGARRPKQCHGRSGQPKGMDGNLSHGSECGSKTRVPFDSHQDCPTGLWSQPSMIGSLNASGQPRFLIHGSWPRS